MNGKSLRIYLRKVLVGQNAEATQKPVMAKLIMANEILRTRLHKLLKDLIERIPFRIRCLNRPRFRELLVEDLLKFSQGFTFLLVVGISVRQIFRAEFRQQRFARLRIRFCHVQPRRCPLRQPIGLFISITPAFAKKRIPIPPTLGITFLDGRKIMFNRLFIQFDPHGKALSLRPLRRLLRKPDTFCLCSFFCQPFALRRFLRTLRFKFWRIVLCSEISIFRLRELTYQIRNELIAHTLLQGHIRQAWVRCPFVRNPGIWNKDRQPSHPRTCLNCTCS